MNNQLNKILSPDSIAIIGASANPTKRGYKALHGLISGGYQGDIYPINPKQKEILGVATLQSIGALPDGVDLALVCTPATSLPEIIRQCGAKDIKGAIVLASGFSESDQRGAELEQQMLDAAKKSAIRIIGPNTSGMFNLHKKVNLLALDQINAGDIGVISQSGNMLLALALEAVNSGHIGFSTYVGPGNQSDINFSDYLQFLAEDTHTRVATLYVEGFKNGRQFIDQAKQASLKKPVVVYKSGSTEAGQKAAASHTGSLAGSYQMTRDLLQQVGVTMVEQSDEILPVAQGLALLQQADGNRIAVLADGGGQATIASDRISEAGLNLASLNEHTQQQLKDLLFEQASVSNPVDVAGSTDANPLILHQCAEILVKDPNVDMIFVVGMFGGYAIRFAKELHQQEMETAKRFAALSSTNSTPLLIYSLYQPIKPEPLLLLQHSGVPVCPSIEQAVQIMKALSQRGSYIAQKTNQDRIKELSRPLSARADVNQMLDLSSSDSRFPYEHEAKWMLSQYGIKTPAQQFVRQPEELNALNQNLIHSELAMKVVSRDIIHKSDAGGVKLKLRGEAALQQSYQQIIKNCRHYDPSAEIEGVLLTPMAKPGVEIIIGVSNDPIFGPVLMFGLGGIFVEILKDVAFRAIPITRHDAYSMISQIKAGQILNGARGQTGVDKEALVELLISISQIVEMHPQISELDLNPVIAYPNGYAIVDARIITHSSNKKHIKEQIA